MTAKYCRRVWWVRFIRWSVIASVLFLVTWTYRSWVMHGVNILSSSEYRECENRRSQYLGDTVNDQSNHQPKLYVTMAHHGRLGNWMFQYASLMGIAEANGFTPYFLEWHSLSYSFQLTHLSSDRADCNTVVEDPKPMSYIPKLMDRLPKSNISLDGYFQSWKYFRFINNRVRKEFRFTDTAEKIIRKKFDTYVGRYVRAGREVISIHVRRGDMARFGAQRLGFKPAPAEYFANAMHYMVKRHPFSVFLVVSDDLEWCWKNIETVVLKYYKEEEKDREGLENRNGADYLRWKAGKIFVMDRKGNEEPLDPNAKNTEKLIASIHEKQNALKDTNELERVEATNENDKDERDFVLSGSPQLVIAPLGSSLHDLGLLTLANHSIMSVGSFGWWGAWLAGGEVVYYKNWPEKDHAVYYQYTQEDFFPPGWVPMSGGSGMIRGSFSRFSVASRLVLAAVVVSMGRLLDNSFLDI